MRADPFRRDGKTDEAMSEWNIAVDDRPRCEALGRYKSQPIPCHRHAGHTGPHEWTDSRGQVTITWRHRQKRVSI